MFQILLNWVLKLPEGNRTFATAVLQIVAAALVLIAMSMGLMPYEQSSASVALFAVIDGFKAIYHRAALDRMTTATAPPESVAIQEPIIVGKEYPK